MSDSVNNTTMVKILGQEYKVKCPPDKVAELQESASYVHHAMQEVRDTGRVVGIDRVAVITALNIAYEMLMLRKQKQAYIDGLSQRIFELQEKIEAALNAEAV